MIIPVLGEARRIGPLLDRLRAMPGGGDCEIVVVDGDPDGSTVAAIRRRDVVTLVSPRGRAAQMNAGARIARGRVLFFLHADTMPPADAFPLVRAVLDQPGPVCGAFSYAVNSTRWRYRLIGVLGRLRARLTLTPYGDSALFLERRHFDGLGGFRAMPFLEDVEFVRRFKEHGGRVRVLAERAVTSVRRMEREGVLVNTVRNALVLGLYRLGVPPETLDRLYRS